MEILENVLRGWTIEVDTHMFGGVNVPRLPRCVAHITSDAETPILSAYIMNIVFQVATSLCCNNIPTISSRFVDVGHQYKCTELKGYNGTQQSILQRLSGFKQLYGETDIEAPVAVLIQIDPPKKARVLRWYNDQDMRTAEPRRRLPLYTYDTSAFAEFAAIVEQHVSGDMHQDVIEALGKALDEILATTPFHVRIDADLSILIDHPVLPAGVICSCNALTIITANAALRIYDIKGAVAGYNSIPGVTPH